MSGPRPVHLKRRGAVYAVRFRLPKDLAERCGITELQRSLQTKDVCEAKRRCLEATIWFRQVSEQLRQNPAATRVDLERMAQAYFDHRALRNHDRALRTDHFAEDDLAEQIELTRSRLGDLDHQIAQNAFSRATEVLGEAFLRRLAVSLEDVKASTFALANQLAARAERQQLRYLEHQLTTPTGQFVPDDGLFGDRPRGGQGESSVRHLVTTELEDFDLDEPAASSASVGPTLREAADQFLARKQAKGRGASHLTELARATGWLMEVVGERRPLSKISRQELREFRDDLERLDVTLRGRSVPFKARLTNEPDERIRTVTAQRYWRSITQLFAWAADEFDLDADPCIGLRMEGNSRQFRQSPEAYSREEVKTLLATPLFTGWAGGRRYSVAGPQMARAGHFWSGLMPLFSGLRAGELSQLVPSDFHFDGEVPYFRLTRDEAGKTLKNAGSVRDIPISPVLITLGLREFVERRNQTYPGQRVFREFPLGSGGRKAGGLTAFWGRYLRQIDLHKPGRATHVNRHTVVDRLREAFVSEEDVAALLGHHSGSGRGSSETRHYGTGDYPLARKAATVAKIDYGFDVVRAVGGPFNKNHHGI